MDGCDGLSAMRATRFGRFLRDGGWVVVLAVVLTCAGVAVNLAPVLRRSGHRIGDGSHPSSYGYALAPATIPVDRIVAGGLPKDGLRALVDPPTWTVAEVESFDRRHRAKYLIAGDRVIGIEGGAVSRAYPLRVLVWHEIVNDTVAGRPIAVTYNPLCDSAVVFDRRIGGRTLSFGFSGLLYNSNLLMYEVRRPVGGESLWSQLLLRAVTGPAAAAGDRLTPLHFTLTSWSKWRAAHPETQVLAPDPRLAGEYQSDPYANYFGSDELRFPVFPLPRSHQPPWKTPLLVVTHGATFTAFSWPALHARADARGEWETTLDGQRLRFAVSDHPPTATVEAVTGPSPPAVWTSYFAWYAMHSSDTTWVLH
jgi:hypothetical protein